MKKYIRSSEGITYLQSRKDMAAKIAEDIMEWQDSLVGPAFLSECLTDEDIETLDKARIILYKYSDEA